MRYFKYRWDETRGDAYDAWGTSSWFVEVDLERYAVRQIEVYEHGPVLTYDRDHLHDPYGALGDQPWDESVPGMTEITALEFEACWSKVVSINR